MICEVCEGIDFELIVALDPSKDDPRKSNFVQCKK